MGGVICMSDVIDISPANLDSRLCLLQPVFLIFYIEYNIQMTKYSLDVLIFLFGTSLLFHIQFSLFLPDLHKGCSRDMSGHLIIPCLSEVSILFCDSQIKSFGIVNKTEKKCISFILLFFFWNSFDFSMIYWMLLIWSLVTLPFLKPNWTSGSSTFIYCWSLA